jgi:hypothetical protein
LFLIPKGLYLLAYGLDGTLLLVFKVENWKQCGFVGAGGKIVRNPAPISQPYSQEIEHENVIISGNNETSQQYSTQCTRGKREWLIFFWGGEPQ